MAYDFVNKLLQDRKNGQAVQQAPAPQSPTPTPQPQVDLSGSGGSNQSSSLTFKQPANLNMNPHGKYFSGNLLSKAFDVLNTPYYAVAGFDKGEQNAVNKLNQQSAQTGQSNRNLGGFSKVFMGGIKNILPGIVNRTQIGREAGDFNAGKYLTKNKYGQTAFNFLASLGAPSLPLGKAAPILRAVGEAPGISRGLNLASKLGGDATQFLRDTPQAANLIEKIPGLQYFRNPAVGRIISGSQDVANRRVSGLFNEINDMAKGLTPQERVTVGHMIEGIVPKTTNTKLAVRANRISQISDQIGQELVNLGVMKPETFQKYKGNYLSHIADTVKNLEQNNTGNKALKFYLNSLKERKNILGAPGKQDYIRQFQFPAFKVLGGEMKTAESTKALKQIADTTGKTVNTSDLIQRTGGPRVTQDGYVLLKDLVPNQVARVFKNTAVPPEVADYVSKSYTSKAPGLLDRALNAWKLGKTIFGGPGYHARNIMSNVILADMQTGEGLAGTVRNYIRAVKAYKGGGDAKMQQYLGELKDLGVVGRTGLHQGIEHLNPEVFGQGVSKLKKIINKPGEFQGAAEDTAKLNVYSLLRNRGMAAPQAAKLAEEAIFSPYRISQAERGAVRQIIPFYTFTRQALPFTVKTALNHPERLTKYTKAKTAIEGLSPQGANNNKSLPDYMSGQIRLPIKDKNGNYAYFDPTYIYPFGNFTSVGVNQGSLPFGLSVNPLAMEGAQQLFNKDLYFGNSIAKSNIPARATAQRVQHAYQTLAPNIMPTDFVGGIPTGQPGISLNTRGGSKLYSAFTGGKDYAGRKRSRVQALLDTMGLKSSFYDPTQQQKFNSIDLKKQLDAINKEYYSTMLDQSIKPQDKQKIIKDLILQRQKLISGQ